MSLSFNSLASLHLLGVASMGSNAVASSMTWARDFQHGGPCCTFRHIGPCHCQLKVLFSILVVFNVTAISPRFGCTERPLRDPLNQFPSLVLRIYVPQSCSDLTCKPSEWCAARPALHRKSLSVLRSQSVSCRIDPCLDHVPNGVGQTL